ncbi:MAG: hypothetical protein WBG71_07585 [Leeuwenhoekiella sp.]
MKKLTIIALLILTTSFGFGQKQEDFSLNGSKAVDINHYPSLTPLINFANTPSYVDKASPVLSKTITEEKTIASELPKAYLKLHHLQRVTFENYTYYTILPKELANRLLTNYLG